MLDPRTTGPQLEQTCHQVGSTGGLGEERARTCEFARAQLAGVPTAPQEVEPVEAVSGCDVEDGPTVPGGT